MYPFSPSFPSLLHLLNPTLPYHQQRVNITTMDSDVQVQTPTSSFSSSSPQEMQDPIIQFLTGPSQTIYIPDVHEVIKTLREKGCDDDNNKISSAISRISFRRLDLSTRRFGSFGGRYAPELQMEALTELGNQFRDAICDIDFWKQFLNTGFVEKTPLQLAKNLTQQAGGANIWLKREDFSPFSSHKVRNIVGQTLLAKRMGKTEIVMDCGFAGHGLVCAALCEKLGLKCTIFMGSFDGKVQEKKVREIQNRGASVTFADNGLGCYTIRAALDDAHRHAISRFDDAFYFPSGPIGPHPLPLIHRFFQALLGEEVKEQCADEFWGEPDAIVAPVGMGSGAVGMFAPFIDSPEVKLVGVQPASAAPLVSGELGVLYGACSYLLQDNHGQVLNSHSYAEDLACPTVGPELAHWKHGRVEFVDSKNEDAVDGMMRVRDSEGFVPDFATGYAVEKAVQVARALGKHKEVVLLVAGDYNPFVEIDI